MNANVLQEKIYADWKASIEYTDRLEAILNSRLEYVLTRLFNAFDYKLETWCFVNEDEDYEDARARAFSVNANGDIENICAHYTILKDGKDLGIKIINKYGVVWEYSPNHYNGSIPLRWLFEDFEPEIIAGRDKFIAKREEELRIRKEKRDAKKLKEMRLKEEKKANVANDKSVLDALMKKLSPEELAAIKRAYIG